MGWSQLPVFLHADGQDWLGKRYIHDNTLTGVPTTLVPDHNCTEIYVITTPLTGNLFKTIMRLELKNESKETL